MFYLHEKMRILISLNDPDYYVMVSEACRPKNLEIQQCRIIDMVTYLSSQVMRKSKF